MDFNPEYYLRYEVEAMDGIIRVDNDEEDRMGIEDIGEANNIVNRVLSRMTYNVVNAMDAANENENLLSIVRLQVTDEQDRINNKRGSIECRGFIGNIRIRNLIRKFLEKNWHKIMLKNLKSGIIRTEPIDD